ncbi:MAG: hypothetical protein KF891_01460 [Rhizobacter sp.]|nr:hypothetical protein [Rhizobacter sp.]
MIESAKAFLQLLEAEPPEAFRLAWVEAPVQVWWDVLDRYPQLSVWVAANFTIPDEIVAHLARHGSTQARTAVASRASLPEALLMLLAHDKDELVRLRVAFNRHATPGVLGVLAGDVCVVVSMHAQARLTYDLNGHELPRSYLDSVSLADLLH